MTLWFTHPQLRMLAAPPMDRQDDLTHCFIDVGDDVGDEGAQKLLTRAHGDIRRVLATNPLRHWERRHRVREWPRNQ